ncbi:MAG TPA: DUF433 domain-containing protein [Verrucomicrobiae bacterium]|nr:DUF433 domain-containing protein [Verrucomicrobiae bacterium]
MVSRSRHVVGPVPAGRRLFWSRLPFEPVWTPRPTRHAFVGSNRQRGIDQVGWTRRLRGRQAGCTPKGLPQALSSEPFPLETGPDDVIGVRGTRVTLDTVWAAFHEGATAEEIAQQYPSPSLADAYQAIGYCLRNPDPLAAYLAKRSGSAEETRRSNESRWLPDGIRARLVERRPR